MIPANRKLEASLITEEVFLFEGHLMLLLFVPDAIGDLSARVAIFVHSKDLKCTCRPFLQIQSHLARLLQGDLLECFFGTFNAKAVGDRFRSFRDIDADSRSVLDLPDVSLQSRDMASGSTSGSGTSGLISSIAFMDCSHLALKAAI